LQQASAASCTPGTPTAPPCTSTTGRGMHLSQCAGRAGYL
jgi:hypothetical protein